MNKKIPIIIMALTSLLILSSCDNAKKREEHDQAIINTGYRQGMKDGIKKAQEAFKKNAEEIHKKLTRNMISAMTAVAVLFVLMTLFGPWLIDKIKSYFVERFHISLNIQIYLLWWGYLTIVTAILLYTLISYTTKENVPIFILVSGTLIPFVNYLDSVKNKEKLKNRLYLGKLKSLFMVSAIVIALYVILNNGITAIL